MDVYYSISKTEIEYVFVPNKARETKGKLFAISDLQRGKPKVNYSLSQIFRDGPRDLSYHAFCFKLLLVMLLS